MKSTMVWLSYDLGINGDYEGMYTWLAKHKAKECGDSVGVFTYKHRDDFIHEITKEIMSAVQLDQKSRIYVVRREDGKVGGRFIAGSRHVAPWAGFAEVEDQTEDSDE